MICALAGFNRTGFVVCAYLILVCGLSVQEALGNFAAARPPGVKHEKFVVEVSTLSSHTYSLSREILPPQTVRHTMQSRFCACSNLEQAIAGYHRERVAIALKQDELSRLLYLRSSSSCSCTGAMAPGKQHPRTLSQSSRRHRQRPKRRASPGCSRGVLGVLWRATWRAGQSLCLSQHKSV